MEDCIAAGVLALIGHSGAVAEGWRQLAIMAESKGKSFSYSSAPSMGNTSPSGMGRVNIGEHIRMIFR